MMRLSRRFSAFSGNSSVLPKDAKTWGAMPIMLLASQVFVPGTRSSLARLWEGALLYTVLPAFAAFFSRAASFFCLLDLGAAFCSFFCFCSLFAMNVVLPFKVNRNKPGMGEILAAFPAAKVAWPLQFCSVATLAAQIIRQDQMTIHFENTTAYILYQISIRKGYEFCQLFCLSLNSLEKRLHAACQAAFESLEAVV